MTKLRINEVDLWADSGGFLSWLFCHSYGWSPEKIGVEPVQVYEQLWQRTVRHTKCRARELNFIFSSSSMYFDRPLLKLMLEPLTFPTHEIENEGFFRRRMWGYGLHTPCNLGTYGTSLYENCFMVPNSYGVQGVWKVALVMDVCSE